MQGTQCSGTRQLLPMRHLFEQYSELSPLKEAGHGQSSAVHLENGPSPAFSVSCAPIVPMKLLGDALIPSLSRYLPGEGVLGKAFLHLSSSISLYVPWPDPLSSIGGSEGEGCEVLGGTEFVDSAGGEFVGGADGPCRGVGINDDIAASVIAPPELLV